jgi:hypothetical protein
LVLGSTLNVYANRLTMMPTASTWVIRSSRPKKCLIALHVAHSASASPTRCSSASPTAKPSGRPEKSAP